MIKAQCSEKKTWSPSVLSWYLWPALKTAFQKQNSFIEVLYVAYILRTRMGFLLQIFMREFMSRSNLQVHVRTDSRVTVDPDKLP